MIQKIITLWLVAFVTGNFLTLLAVVGYNAWACWTEQMLITHFARELAKQEPMLPFLFGLTIGFLASHLFWFR